MVVESETKVVKRNGSVEPINLEKVHKMVEAACIGIAGVSESSVEMNSGLQFYDGMPTKEIQDMNSHRNILNETIKEIMLPIRFT